ncbi:hypothetical protein GT037_000156 [Alternaria burnsii]|uniref:Uncharacterized protein n=1 Tax=Alternaria burnsii TaxID=1187904 RepID=A0A8H7BBR8_9PLEO|nr:uncharacterized protein GT037_000156 [Alternaria burnsii]KAF7681180.1 hypothetical protein GT037_000156 [Alternaria burnsii]
MTTQDPNNVGWVSEPTTRGTSSLLYTCISTTIICTWSALHLNVPREGLSASRVLLYKIVGFMLAIIAPEYFVACAVGECFAAHRISKILAEILPGGRKWSHAFSHLISMRGVKLRLSTAPDAPEAILRIPDMIRFIEQGWIECEEFSIAAVQDKSKANPFNKTVASIQIFWFFSQLLGRLTSTIEISPLEWFTLAYVMCAFFMYGFWWYKPFDVQTPLLIYPDPSLSAEQTLELKHSLPKCLKDRHKWNDIGELLDLVPDKEELNTMTTRDRVWIDQLPINKLFTIAIAISIVLFGSCHLFGWNYPFPTTLETYLWRSASISCVCVPLTLLALAFLIPVGGLSGLWDMLEDYAWATLSIIYVLVRLFLLFEVFFALRSSPPEIYKAVPWAQYLPHI